MRANKAVAEAKEHVRRGTDYEWEDAAIKYLAMIPLTQVA